MEKSKKMSLLGMPLRACMNINIEIDIIINTINRIRKQFNININNNIYIDKDTHNDINQYISNFLCYAY